MKNNVAFSSTKLKTPFDWNAFFKKETYTNKELKKADDLAGAWTTCACGNQCAIIDRDREDGNRPLDERLEKLGCDFSEFVSNMNDAQNDISNLQDNDEDVDSEEEIKFLTKEFNKNKKNAINTLARIEKRSITLIEKEIKNLQNKASYVGLKLVKA